MGGSRDQNRVVNDGVAAYCGALNGGTSMTRIRICLLLLVGATALGGCRGKSNDPTGGTTPKARAKTPGELTVLKQYKGRVRFGGTIRGSARTRRGLVFIIRTQKRYDAFRATIPKRVIQMKKPAPPSKDPLLAKPAIDFKKQMLVVAQRPHMHVGPRLEKVVARPGTVTVHVFLPSLDTVHKKASVAGIGTYHAVLVPRADGDSVYKVRIESDIP